MKVYRYSMFDRSALQLGYIVDTANNTIVHILLIIKYISEGNFLFQILESKFGTRRKTKDCPPRLGIT